MIRHRFETYLDKVFGFSDLISALPEGRQFPQHSWKKVFDAVFLGAAMQIPSLLQVEAECRHGALSKRIGAISDDTLGYSLQRELRRNLDNRVCSDLRFAPSIGNESQTSNQLRRNGP